MNKILLSAALALVMTSAALPQGKRSPIPMVFHNEKISTVVQMVARVTHANIIYVPPFGLGGSERTERPTVSGTEVHEVSIPEPLVSLRVRADSAEAAVRDIAASSGLIYRKVSNRYILAEPSRMRDALAKYGQSREFLMDAEVAKAITDEVQKAFPYATIRAIDNRLIIVGTPEDIQSSQWVVGQLQRRENVSTRENEFAQETVFISRLKPSDVLRAFQTTYPEKEYPSLKIAAVDAETNTGSAGGRDFNNSLPKPGGVMTFSGPRPLVMSAVALARQIDAASPVANAQEYRVYNIRYLGATKLADFMKSAMQDVETFIAPETQSPERAAFNPLTSAISTSLGSGGSGTTGSSGLNGGGLNGSNGGGNNNSNGQSNSQDKDLRARRLVLRGEPSRLDSAMRLLQSIDLKPQQLYVEVQVVEADPKVEENVGFDWSWSPLQFFEKPAGTGISAGDSTTGLRNLGSTVTRPGNLGSWSRAPLSFSALLTSKVTRGEARMLANPKVGVTDNDGASIFIGDTIRAQVAQATGLGTQTIQIEEFPVGIILLIHPRINADGNITMHVNPVVSTVTDIINGLPQTSSREAETTLIVKDGETIVLGGLIQDSYSKVVTEVPFLSKLPIIGELFKNRSKSKKRTDVIITITPHIMKDDEAKK